MYVASGNTLHWYKDAGWDSVAYRIPQPGGRIVGLAATTKYLYALCLSGSGVDIVLKRIEINKGWETISSNDTYPVSQTIYADHDTLFVGAMIKNSLAPNAEFGILSVADTETKLTLLGSDTGLLSGAVYDGTTYFLSTRVKGVYKVNGSNLDKLSGGDHEFMGMTKLGTGTTGKIIAIERNGTLYEVDTTGLTDRGGSTGKLATGALAFWEGNGKEMLTAGIQEQDTSKTTFTHGYLEYDIVGGLPVNPESPNTTVDGYTDRYQATIGKHPINYMHQASSSIDGTRRFFASTQSAGLWSYKNRSGGPQWNAEN